jgi:exosortase family protein XrtF
MGKFSKFVHMPASIKFIIWFLISYLLLQLGYTLYLNAYNPNIDPASLFTAKALTWFFTDASLREIAGEAKIQFLLQQIPMVNIKEACNGLSVAMSLLAFLIAYRGKWIDYVWVVPLSVFLLLVANIARLYALVRIKQHYPAYFPFFHEYLFPSLLYVMAFGIMVWWVRKVSPSA